MKLLGFSRCLHLLLEIRQNVKVLEGKDLNTGFQGELLPEVQKMDCIEELREFNNQLTDEARKHLWVRIVGYVLEEKQKSNKLCSNQSCI